MTVTTTPGFFQVTNPGQVEWEGDCVAAVDQELRTGLLAKRNVAADGSHLLYATGANDRPDGFAYTNRTLVYSPTQAEAAVGEQLTLVRGHVRFLADSSFFAGGTLPSYGALLYTAASGLMDTTGNASGFFGRVLGLETKRAAPNTTSNIVLCEAHFSPTTN